MQIENKIIHFLGLVDRQRKGYVMHKVIVSSAVKPRGNEEVFVVQDARRTDNHIT